MSQKKHFECDYNTDKELLKIIASHWTTGLQKFRVMDLWLCIPSNPRWLKSGINSKFVSSFGTHISLKHNPPWGVNNWFCCNRRIPSHCSGTRPRAKNHVFQSKQLIRFCFQQCKGNFSWQRLIVRVNSLNNIWNKFSVLALSKNLWWARIMKFHSQFKKN